LAQREASVETERRVESAPHADSQPPPPELAPICCGGALATREDAIRLLESVCAFIERTEPTNPAPLLIRRARSLMDKDFVAIMQDLAPDGLAQLRLIAGTRDE
jgi:type VI secretion system protein ImpA